MMTEIIAGATIAGWTVQNVEVLPDATGSLVTMQYERNGARLAWLDRDDDNMTFAIAFKTPPDDDTGVAHILEHSVLCGSRKYPVKEPFIDLLKGSFATFLNAWTASDHTAYPVCSRNKADFMNLMDVYLDAVLHPTSVVNPVAFRQEGWHYECDAATGELKRNGVVYSEMKGAMSNPISQAVAESERLTWAGTPYAKASGGDPEYIPSLTFEKYCDFYKLHYHPSNSYVFLDGKVDIKAVLEKLDTFFAPFERCAEIERAASEALCAPRTVSDGVRTVEKSYALPAGESPKDKTILVDQWVFGRFDAIEEREGANILCSALAGSNEEPVAKALLDKGLCESVEIWYLCNLLGSTTLVVQNVVDGKEDEVRQTVRETIAALASGGLDHERLKALISRAEFAYRERDTGKEPRGLVYFSSVMDQWLHGGDISAAFKLAPVYASLRRKVDEGWFEDLLGRMFIDNKDCTQTTMKGDATLGARREEENAAELAAVKASWTSADRSRFEKESAELRAFQQKPDSPEASATLPKLHLEDIPEKQPLPGYFRDGRIVRVKTAASGIVYVSLAFPLDGLSRNELADLAFAAELLGELDTAKRSATAFKNAVDATLGRLSATVGVFGSPDGTARAYLLLRAAALEENAAAIAPLASEMLRESNFDDLSRVGDLLTQQRRYLELSASGLAAKKLASVRSLASVTEAGALSESVAGINAMRRYQSLDDAFVKDGASICAALGRTLKRVAGRGAHMVFLSSNTPEEIASAIAAEFAPSRFDGEEARFALYPSRREGFIGSGAVASAAKSALTPLKTGASYVAAHMLSLDWLWTEIRVKGGAYGGGLAAGSLGTIQYNSWNDPSPARSIGIYDASGEALRRMAGNDFENFIIGTVASFEPYLSPTGEMEFVENAVLCRLPADFHQKRRVEAMRTTKEDLLKVAEALDAAAKSESVCIVGGEKCIEECRGMLDNVEAISSK